MRTCMAGVSTNPLYASLDTVTVTNHNNPDAIMQAVKNEICDPAPANLAFDEFRGSPLYGDWSLAWSPEVAQALQTHSVDELDGICDDTDPSDPEGDVHCGGISVDPHPSASWASANADLAAVELFIVVGAEPLLAGASPKYQEAAYVEHSSTGAADSWRDWALANADD